MKLLNCPLVKVGPLSVTTLRGSPCVAKMILSYSIVLVSNSIWTGTPLSKMSTRYGKVPSEDNVNMSYDSESESEPLVASPMMALAVEAVLVM